MGASRPKQTPAGGNARGAAIRSQIIAFILAYQAGHQNQSPSYGEMRVALGIASNGSLRRHLAHLQDEGRIGGYGSGTYRSIYVIQPESETGTG